MIQMTFKNVAKWVWLTAVLVFVVYYAVYKKDLIAQALPLLPLESLLAAIVFVFVAKLCLMTNMRIAALHFSIKFSWGECYRIYNLTQLAKYIPGSIWQFVGRIAILRERGVAMKDIRDSLLVEHVWVVSSAALIAFVTVLSSSPDYFEEWLAEYGIEVNLSWVIAVFSMIVCASIIALLLNPKLLHWSSLFVPPVKAFPVLILIWVFLGASLWVTLASFATTMPSLSYIIGIYGFAYVVGFFVPFAPAGLGIREAALTFALIPFMSADEAILLAAINRIVYFVVEIIAASLTVLRLKLTNSC